MIIFLRNNVKDNKKVLLLHRRSEKKIFTLRYLKENINV